MVATRVDRPSEPEGLYDPLQLNVPSPFGLILLKITVPTVKPYPPPLIPVTVPLAVDLSTAKVKTSPDTPPHSLVDQLVASTLISVEGAGVFFFEHEQSMMAASPINIEVLQSIFIFKD